MRLDTNGEDNIDASDFRQQGGDQEVTHHYRAQVSKWEKYQENCNQNSPEPSIKYTIENDC